MPSNKNDKIDTKFKYNKHQIVWAKISGYPWWPALIILTPSKSNTNYKVDFIGDKSYAYLPESKLAKYLQHRQEYESNKKQNKNLINAITIAADKYQQSLQRKGSERIKQCGDKKITWQKQILHKQIQSAYYPLNLQSIKTQNKKSTHYQEQQYKLQKQSHQIKNTQQKNSPKEKEFKHIHSQIILNKVIQVENKQKIVKTSPAIEQNIQKQQQQQKAINSILVKYKLDVIPNLKQKKQQQQIIQNQSNGHGNQDKKIKLKKKPISKQRNTKQLSINQNNEVSFSQDDLIVRKIYRYLLKKLHYRDSCQSIAVNLTQQIVRQKINRYQCLKKALEWILMSQPDNIINYHNQWVNFYKESEREREKQSTLTMQCQSEEQFIK